jgi:hypothetical protein
MKGSDASGRNGGPSLFSSHRHVKSIRAPSGVHALYSWAYISYDLTACFHTLSLPIEAPCWSQRLRKLAMSADGAAGTNTPAFLTNMHVAHCIRCLRGLPAAAIEADCMR